jgi:tRNA threonylcarbamoyladenosine biosynthesis protein TsaB
MALRESDEGRDHAKKVALFVDELLRETGVQPSDLDAIAVGKGPGSYTGLRIGVSFAKGMCYALDIPLIAIGSLDALTEVAREDYDAGILDIEEEEWAKAKLCPLVDARRMEVYAEVFDNEGKALTDVAAEVVTEDSFKEWRKDKFVIFGNGAKKCTELLSDAIFVDIAPSARGIVRLAEESFKAQKFEDLAYFEPFYLKEFLVIPSKKKLL